MPITHLKVSTIPDGTDPTLLQPSDWNADHTGLENVTNDEQTKSEIVPNTPPSTGQILIGNGIAYTPVSLSGDATLTSTGVMSITGYLKWARAGETSISTGTLRLIAPKTLTINDANLQANTAPTGASLIINILKNGVSQTTITLTSGSNSVTASGLNISMDYGDYLTINITQTGSTISGSDLSLLLRYS